ncbi:MAG TPA: septal ring lytic transglycosylase RlpA family protein [Steroidobacteraceae bacterium]|nr:septal ring lytic transglycosylase RlpA family protein [Steroidobacteraceae bacterium]
MKPVRALALPLCAAVAVGMAACSSAPRRPESPSPAATPEPVTTPPAQTVPDVVPRIERRSRTGNPPFYDVLGKRYFVLSSSVGYVERGVASWYGPGFHKVPTSIGETYNMYGMSAAHKTLPLPAYVRVTNLQNGRSIVVRVNDRGPFVGNRIIDLSYTAASKLDMLRNGTAMVEVRSLDAATAPAPVPAPEAPITAADSAPAAAPLTASPLEATSSAAPLAGSPVTGSPVTGSTVTQVAVPAALFIQAGAFSDPKNAERLVERLRGGGYGKIFVRDDEIAGRRMYRVRIGPVPNVAEYDRIVAALARAGVHDAHLALD